MGEFICENCEGTNIELKAWINPNTWKASESLEVGQDLDDQWCEDCQEHVNFKFRVKSEKE